jgi:hypothetical protein
MDVIQVTGIDGAVNILNRWNQVLDSALLFAM